MRKQVNEVPDTNLMAIARGSVGRPGQEQLLLRVVLAVLRQHGR